MASKRHHPYLFIILRIAVVVAGTDEVPFAAHIHPPAAVPFCQIVRPLCAALNLNGDDLLPIHNLVS